MDELVSIRKEFDFFISATRLFKIAQEMLKGKKR